MRALIALGLVLLIPAACSTDDTAPAGGNLGDCPDASTCMTLDEFQAQSPHCPDSPDSPEVQEWLCPGPAWQGTCEGLETWRFQYGFTGDYVQCWYGADGALAGAIRTSDHGWPLVAGTRPECPLTSVPCGDGGADGGDAGDALDCSIVGCAAPPLCAVGCESECGCCPCDEGTTEDIGGVTHTCTRGCWQAP